MTPDEILSHCLHTLEGTVLVSSWGERGIFYNPGGKLKRGVYVLTVKEQNGENDKSSRLDREGVYRVNLRPSSASSAPCLHARPKAESWRCPMTFPSRIASCPTPFTPGWAGSAL